MSIPLLFAKRRFNPRSLFAAGEQGVWYDPSDFSSMFQDSAGTTPVTAVGDPVGLILDKSGRGNHASQTTTTSMPILRQDTNGKYYLEFDGADDWLTATTAASTWKWLHDGTVLNTVFAGASFGVVTDPEAIYALCGTSGTTVHPTGWYIAHDTRASSSRDRVMVAVAGGATSAQTLFLCVQNAGATPANTTLIVNAINDPSNATLSQRGRIQTNLNGYQSTVPSGTGSVNTSDPRTALQIGAVQGSAGSNTFFLSGRLYGLIVRGARGTDEQITQTIRWMAGKSGVSL